ncbi:MAG: signal recognition particle protein [Synergistaceae bacterium]|nr:signal recognition particle protein [Synergistaceae bacterium]MBQ7570319.1 signal recognition particle protein [Synergistaceae bacterium]MBQ9580877.1 signal recognition particle protein [Synergistaceae bacterium]MBQ9897262.1 signal recognition particle protein [Synergistaceae bacterium]MBR0045224.1 signal recognition particle protein [Synergistaceae bacterium]
MFENLKDKLESVIAKLRSKGKLSEADIDLALRELRKSLLEADVDFKITRDIIAKIRERAVKLDVLESISATQHISTIVYEELINLMGEPAPLIISPKPPTVILMAGLQGSGKTTTTVKLARKLKSSHNPLVVACDLRRPAAVDQLKVLAEASGISFYGPASDKEKDVLKVVEGCKKFAEAHMNDVILLDTAGRLHIDEELMAELASIAKILPPHEKLLVADSMMGQEAVNVAKSFHELLTLTGVILTKLDGDTRGGSALAIRAVTGVPVKFAGVGENTDALEVFDAKRMAGRIMGMGDIQGLFEKVQAAGIDADAEKIAKTLKGKKGFTLETLLMQFEQIEKMGPLGKVMEMIPGFSKLKNFKADDLDNSIIAHNKAIILSMTPEERRNPAVIKGSRRRRIALGSGTSVQMVNQLLAQYEQMKKLFKTLGSGNKSALRNFFSGKFKF